MIVEVVDSFTERPFAGNPAAVAVVEAFPSDSWMQALAREMNLSETAFARPREDGRYDLRWFSPATEVDLCGHATLATAHVLGGEGRFVTRGGELTCRRRDDGAIEMDFPADPVRPAPVPEELSGLGPIEAAAGRSDLLLRLPSPEHVLEASPDLAAIARLPHRLVMITAEGGPEGADFVSRVFGPGVGIPEDPVTGSAHCTLACFWGDRLQRSEMVGYQASARGGVVQVRQAGDRVFLAGHAVSVSKVELLVPVG